LEVRTNLSESVFEALFKGVSTKLGLRLVEKCLENGFGKVGSDFQNLRLGKLATKDSSIPENQHIASSHATIFCNHLASLLQKLIASQKNQHIASDPEIPDLTIIRPNGVSKNRPQVHTPSLWYILADIRPHWTSRRQLTPILDKPAFSRIP
jgi:hypothetical protein